MKFLLTSSGLRNQHIVKALVDLVGKPFAETSLMFVPSAANTEVGDKGWLIDNLIEFKKHGFKSVDMLDIAGVHGDEWKKRFEGADVICFGGGNELYLAELCKKIGMKEFLFSEAKGKVYMGISAGSMVAGKFVSDTLRSALFPEEDFGTTAVEPMELYPFAFIPHLNSSFFSQVRKEVLDSHKEEYESPVYATDDETALRIDGDSVDIIGEGDYWIYRD